MSKYVGGRMARLQAQLLQVSS